MSIDWSKYGVSSDKKSGTIDWSKYLESPTATPTITPEQSAFETQISEQAQLENQARNNADKVSAYQEQISQGQQRMMDTELSDAAQLENQSRANSALVEADPQAYTPEQEPLFIRAQKAIYNKTLGPVTDAAYRIAGNVVDPFHLARGIAEREGMQTDLRNNPIIGELAAPQTTGEKVTDIVGQVAGSVVPGGLAYKAIGVPVGKVAAKVATPAIEKFLASQGIDAATALGTFGRGAGAGLGYGALREGLEAATGDEQSLGGRAKDIAFDTALGGVGDLAVGAVGRSLSRNKSVAPELIQPTQANSEVLALPPASRYESAKARSEGNVLPTNETPIYGQGDIHTFQLPEATLPREIKAIHQEVNQIITPPYENPTELAKYVRQHLGDQVSMNEVRKLSYDDLSQLAGEVHNLYQQNMDGLVRQVAENRGHNWDELMQGRSVTGKADTPISKVGYKQQPQTQSKPVVAARNPVQPEVEVIQPPVQSTSKHAAERATQAAKNAPHATTTKPPVDEPKFAQTVKESEHTAPGLAKSLEEKPMVGARTSDVLNRQEAQKLIDKHGQEGLYSKLMAKTKQFSASETTAAQILAKQYSSLGGDENLSKAIDLVSKTAKGGREMGQAIQALSQWNKLDAEGALLLGERQLNKGVRDTSEWQKLTPAQGAPLTEAAQRIGTAQETKSLADEVLNIVTNKQAGEALTDAEKATIKQFQDQVKLINEKGKGILTKPKAAKQEEKANETIKKVSQIQPKERTRDQVVNFLEAKAEKARKRLAASRNIGFVPVNTGNPVIDYSIIGAAHIAKGIVKLADFTEQMVKDFGESVKPHINEVFTKATNIFRRENGLPSAEELDKVVRNAVSNERFSPEEAAQFKAWASEIGFMTNEFKREATQDLQAAMKELGDSTLGQKIATIQTGAQLLNAVTVTRNVLGNAALITAEKINKVAAVPIDYAFSKLTGERTIKWLPKNQEKMHLNFMMGGKGGWKGVSPSGTLDSYGIHPNVFGKRNPLKYISKSLGASMQGFDHAAYRSAYGDVLATYGEQLGIAQGLTKSEIKKQMPKLIEQLDTRIHDLADEAGRYATFQDDTLLSQGAEMLKRGLNKLTDLPAQRLVEQGLLPKKLSTEGFGVGDIVLKYAKTPANLIMRAMDYSPIGFVRGIMHLAPLVFNKSKFNQFKATRALSRAITGTVGLTGLGYILADAGVLTGSSSMDKDTRSIQEQSGQGAYKVNWSALTRFFKSGFDKDAAKFKKGDHLMDYQWLQPAAISVAMGVNANKAVNDRKEGADTAGWQVAQKSLLGGLQTILENPMVQGVSQVVDAASDIIKKQDPTKLKNIGKGVPASFVPTLLNQARAATDNNQRETFDENIFVEIGNLMKNKVPGLSKSLPVSYDSLGNARERIQGGEADTVRQYLTSFFSPAKLTEYKVSPEAKIVLDLMNQSGDQNVLPRISNRYIHVSQGKDQKDLRVDLTAEQYSKLQQNVGQMVTSKLASKANTLSNPEVSTKRKVELVKEILTDVGKKAREDIGTQLGYKKKDIKS